MTLVLQAEVQGVHKLSLQIKKIHYSLIFKDIFNRFALY